MRLSKSLYVRGLQCSKSLWLKKYKNAVLSQPSQTTQAIFRTGHEVGELACQLFRDPKRVDFDRTNYQGMLHATQTFIDNKASVICEASFEYDSIFVAVDILRIDEKGSMYIYEVKSSTQVKDVYKHDASIQYYVLNGLGYNVKSVNIVHINNQYVRQESLDIDKLFLIKDITQDVQALQSTIYAHLQHFEKVLSDPQSAPIIDIGIHCNEPYECDAKAYCWQDVPSNSVFNIARLSSSKKFELYHKGIIRITDIVNIDEYSHTQQIQIHSQQTQSSIIDKKAIKAFVEKLSYPVYFLDFETFQQAIPKYQGVQPFGQIPFEYSIHIQHIDGRLEHKAHLAQTNTDPRYNLAKQLIEDVPSDAMVLAYNMGFEKSVLRTLAQMFVPFQAHLMAIHDNMHDLMSPFQNKEYYTPVMKGSYSIKYVLPALVPEFESAYDNLELVRNGSQAMQAFASMPQMSLDKQQAYRNALLKYCELDTLAMVKILNKLKEVA